MAAFLIMLLAAALTPQAAPGAQAAPAATPERRIVSIPFDPPLGQTLNYRFTSTEAGRGRPQTMTLGMRIVFRRDGAGYVMTSTYDLPPTIPRAHPTIAPLLRPLELRLDAEGTIIGMVDEAAYWAALDGIMDDLIRGMGADARGAEAARIAIRTMRAMPDAERLALIAGNVSPLLQCAGMEMAVGETVADAFETETTFGPVAQETEVTLEGADGDIARVRSVIRLAPGQIERAERQIEERYGAEAAANVRRVNATAQLPPERAETYEVSLRTGLTERYTRRVAIAAAPGAAPAPPSSSRIIVRVP